MTLGTGKRNHFALDQHQVHSSRFQKNEPSERRRRNREPPRESASIQNSKKKSPTLPQAPNCFAPEQIAAAALSKAQLVGSQGGKKQRHARTRCSSPPWGAECSKKKEKGILEGTATTIGFGAGKLLVQARDL